MRIAILFFFTLLFSVAFSQKKKLSIEDSVYNAQLKIANSVLDKKGSDRYRVRWIDSLLRAGTITEKEIVGGLYCAEADTWKDIYEKKLDSLSKRYENGLKYRRPGDTTADYIFLPIYRLYKKAIDTCYDCRLGYIYDRYEKLDEPYFLDSLLEDRDLNTLIEYGYKKSYDASFLAAGVRITDKNTWYFAEASLFGTYQPHYRVTKENTQTGKKEVYGSSPPVIPTILTAAFEFKDSKNIGFCLSALRITSPVMLDPGRIGIRKTQDSNKWNLFYRPEIGVGWGFFSVSYAYNFMFKKSERKPSDLHYINFRLNFPVGEW